MYILRCVYMYTYVYTYMYTYIYIYIYIYISGRAANPLRVPGSQRATRPPET